MLGFPKQPCISKQFLPHVDGSVCEEAFFALSPPLFPCLSRSVHFWMLSISAAARCLSIMVAGRSGRRQRTRANSSENEQTTKGKFHSGVCEIYAHLTALTFVNIVPPTPMHVLRRWVGKLKVPCTNGAAVRTQAQNEFYVLLLPNVKNASVRFNTAVARPHATRDHRNTRATQRQ